MSAQAVVGVPVRGGELTFVDVQGGARSEENFRQTSLTQPDALLDVTNSSQSHC